MLAALEVLFWTGTAVVFYAYLGYGLVLAALLWVKRRLGLRRARPLDDTQRPLVTFVVCAYNEAEWMARKIANTLAFDYPADRIR